jgi:hypothetical protein
VQLEFPWQPIKHWLCAPGGGFHLPGSLANAMPAVRINYHGPRACRLFGLEPRHSRLCSRSGHAAAYSMCCEPQRSQQLNRLLLGPRRFVSCREFPHIDRRLGLAVAGPPETLDRLSVRREIPHSRANHAPLPFCRTTVSTPRVGYDLGLDDRRDRSAEGVDQQNATMALLVPLLRYRGGDCGFRRGVHGKAEIAVHGGHDLAAVTGLLAAAERADSADNKS